MFTDHSCHPFREGDLNQFTVNPSACAGVREKMSLVVNIDQLGGNTDLLRSQADAALQDIVDIQAPPDLRYIAARFLVGHHRSASNNTEPCRIEASKLGDELVSQPVFKVTQLRVGGKFRKRQDRQAQAAARSPRAENTLVLALGAGVTLCDKLRFVSIDGTALFV